MAQSLFDNSLFQQYLAAAGSDIGSGNPIGANVNAVTNQSISNKNFMKLLQKMMGGDIPEGGKVEVSDTGMKIHVPSTAYTSSGQVPPVASPQVQQPQGGMVNPFVNPTSSPADFSSADLAGLTPEMISQALSFKLQKDQLERQSINDIVDRVYKGALTEQALASAEKARQPVDKRTNDIKNYEYAKAQGFTGTLSDWSNTDPSSWKEYQKAKEEGYEGNFYKWKKELAALGGGLSLDEFAARKEVTGDIESRQYFTDPKGLAKDVDTFINSKESRRELIQYADQPKELQRQTLLQKAKFVESKITASGGKVQDVKMDGRTRVWTVKWPNGKTSEVRYGF